MSLSEKETGVKLIIIIIIIIIKNQNEPALYINDEKIPRFPPGESFVYLGKILR